MLVILYFIIQGNINQTPPPLWNPLITVCGNNGNAARCFRCLGVCKEAEVQTPAQEGETGDARKNIHPCEGWVIFIYSDVI